MSTSCTWRTAKSYVCEAVQGPLRDYPGSASFLTTLK